MFYLHFYLLSISCLFYFLKDAKKTRRLKSWTRLTVYFTYEVCDRTKKRMRIWFPSADCLCLHISVELLTNSFTSSHLDEQICRDGTVSLSLTIKLLIWKLVLHESERMRSPLWRDLSAWAVLKSSWDGDGRKRGETSHLLQRRQGAGNHCRVRDTGEGCQIVCLSVCFCVSVCTHLRSGCVLNDPAGCRVLAGDLRKWAGKMTEAKPGHKCTTKRIKIGFPGITVCATRGMEEGGGVS